MLSVECFPSFRHHVPMRFSCHKPPLASVMTRKVASAVLFWAISLVVHVSPPSYFTHSWQTEDGVPGNNVTAIVQPHDGYLWVGTRSGLTRFDGAHFTIFDSANAPEMHSRHVTSLFEAPDRALWIGHENGELTQYKGGKFSAVPVRALWHGGKISGIGSDRDGDIWLLNDIGELARVRDGASIPAFAGALTRRVAL